MNKDVKKKSPKKKIIKKNAKTVKKKIKKAEEKVNKNANKNFTITIEKKENEPELFYRIRRKFVELSNPKNNKELKLNEMYSNILINMVFLKCSYQDKTEEFIRNFLKKNIKNFEIKTKNIE